VNFVQIHGLFNYNEVVLCKLNQNWKYYLLLPNTMSHAHQVEVPVKMFPVGLAAAQSPEYAIAGLTMAVVFPY
jgi:hypothetical protein